MSLRDFRDSDAAEWRIEWEREDAPESRTTTVTLIAWFANNHDDEATVYALHSDGTEEKL